MYFQFLMQKIPNNLIILLSQQKRFIGIYATKNFNYFNTNFLGQQKKIRFHNYQQEFLSQ